MRSKSRWNVYISRLEIARYQRHPSREARWEPHHGEQPSLRRRASCVHVCMTSIVITFLQKDWKLLVKWETIPQPGASPCIPMERSLQRSVSTETQVKSVCHGCSVSLGLVASSMQRPPARSYWEG